MLTNYQAEVVLHDGAPNVGGGGAWAKDAFNQAELTLHAFKVSGAHTASHPCERSIGIILTLTRSLLASSWLLEAGS
jgi:hypothetical protein